MQPYFKTRIALTILTEHFSGEWTQSDYQIRVLKIYCQRMTMED